MNNTKKFDDPNEGFPYPTGKGQIFWDIVDYFIDPWEPDPTTEGDFVSWYCTHDEFRESAIEEMQEALDVDYLTAEQKAKIAKALLTII